jgi:Transposase IS116/IS110/IS902 family
LARRPTRERLPPHRCGPAAEVGGADGRAVVPMRCRLALCFDRSFSWPTYETVRYRQAAAVNTRYSTRSRTALSSRSVILSFPGPSPVEKSEGSEHNPASNGGGPKSGSLNRPGSGGRSRRAFRCRSIPSFRRAHRRGLSARVLCGGRVTHRLSRRGNRRLNHALHMAAITQIRYPHSPGRRYYGRKLTEGNTPREATRALKRRTTCAGFTPRHLHGAAGGVAQRVFLMCTSSGSSSKSSGSGWAMSSYPRPR